VTAHAQTNSRAARSATLAPTRAAPAREREVGAMADGAYQRSALGLASNQIAVATARSHGMPPSRSVGERSTAAGAESAARAVSGAGRPLPAALRAYFEPRYGTSFAAVRIHTDGLAGTAARAIDAEAYAYGRDVAFAPGRYRPDTRTGLHLIGHELAHVAQGRSAAGPHGVDRAVALGARDSARERDADRMTVTALSGKSARPAMRHDARQVHRFSRPQQVPEKTYIAGQQPENDGFLDDAIRYHEDWGLHPQNIDSLEDVIDDLKGEAGPVRRIRIVTHAKPETLFTSLFEGGPTGIRENELRGFATSAAEGLEALLLPGTSRGFLTDEFYTQVLDQLRQDNPAVLRPFGLDAAGSDPTGVLEEFIRRTIDLLAYRTGNAPPDAPGQMQPIRESLETVVVALRLRVEELRLPTGGHPDKAQVLALENALLGIRAFIFNPEAMSPRFMQGLTAARTALQAGFLADLATVRQRFSSSSWIEIRGCRVGGNRNYLEAVSQFFGRADDRPHVSAPDWFQNFPSLGYRSVRDRELRSYSRYPWVRRALDHWFDETGLVQRLEWARALYLRILIGLRRSRIEASELTGTPSLIGDLAAPREPWLVLPPLLGEVPVAPELTLRAGTRLRAMPSLAGPQPGAGGALTSGAEAEAERLRSEIERLTALRPEEKLRYYFNQDLILPVNYRGVVSDNRLLMSHDRREEAMDNWVNSQWETAAPGLAQMLAANLADGETRRVIGVQRNRNRNNPGERYFSPDRRYQAHIMEI